ncbi:hypothetical protein OEA41_009909 [Lepraria neglecta]|uniref:Uncharacterized protein n=1 Tax=Lepraria neglecta TaxID=209136 RepID=A0AAD9YVF7_9LECA|nr:hypothetical protein OEA41_009909 [Lepraria neglecta]
MSSLEAANLFNVKGLVAVITGGGSGIGAMMTEALALNGAYKVYIIGRRREVLDETAKKSPHGNIIPLVGDVTSKDSLQSIVSHIEQDVGYINVLIANSGVQGPADNPISAQKSLEEYQSILWNQSFEDYSNVFSVNVAAVFFSIIAFLKLLDAGNKKGNVEQKSQVIATSSIGGFNRNVPGGYAYGQSKAGTTHLIKQMATQLVPYGIRSNVIVPGLYPSDMAAQLIGDGVFGRDKIPAERTGTPEDMAGCILYLTSRAGAYCTGNVVVTDGGRLSIMPSTY